MKMPTEQNVRVRVGGRPGEWIDVTAYLDGFQMTPAPEIDDAPPRRTANFTASFTVSRQSRSGFRRTFRNVARLARRPPLIHNGRKPRACR